MTTQDTTVDTADLAPISTASTPEQLEEVMKVARIAANAQAELEANGEDPNAPAEEEAPETPATTEQPGESPADRPAETAPESVYAETTQEPSDEAEEEESDTSQKADEPSYSRRDAARFKGELDIANRDRQTLKAQLQQHQAADAAIITQIQQQAGSEDEYRKLVDKVVAGQATDEERQRANIMQQWRTVAGPIYRQAQVQVTQAWGHAFNAAGQYEGMTDEARQSIMAATDPTTALEAIHAAGLAAGVERTRAEIQADAKKLQSENQRLKAEISILKTRKTTVAPAPATPEGSSPAAMPKLPPMFLEDGRTLNPEFEKLASSGKLLGVEKLTG
jgi:hypothetical protein